MSRTDPARPAPATGVNDPRRPLVGALIAGLALAGSLAACSSGGANTSCSDYRSMSPADRQDAVSAMLQSHGQPITPAKIGLARASVSAYCFTHGANSVIGGVYGSGG